MGRLNIFDKDNKFLGYIKPSKPSIPSGGGGGGGGGIGEIGWFLIIALIGGAILEIKESWPKIVSWLETTSPYKEILIYYSYVLLPLKYLYVGIVKSINIFPIAWKYVVNTGLTQYPNLNLVLGVASMILIGVVILFLINLLYKLIIRLYSIKLVRTTLKVYLQILLLPVYLLIIWYLFLLAKLIFNFIKYIIFSWLLKK